MMTACSLPNPKLPTSPPPVPPALFTATSSGSAPSKPPCGGGGGEPPRPGKNTLDSAEGTQKGRTRVRKYIRLTNSTQVLRSNRSISSPSLPLSFQPHRSQDVAKRIYLSGIFTNTYRFPASSNASNVPPPPPKPLATIVISKSYKRQIWPDAAKTANRTIRRQQGLH